MNSAQNMLLQCYDADTGVYVGENKNQLIEAGAVRIWSSNDDAGNGGWSFSPDLWFEFEDGSVLEVTYSTARVVPPIEVLAFYAKPD